jgi:hypothetical protein
VEWLRVNFLKISVTALAVAAAAAVAQPDASGSTGNRQSETTKTNAKGERLICRMVRDPDTGSLVRGRLQVCLTAEQWTQRDQRGRRRG